MREARVLASPRQGEITHARSACVGVAKTEQAFSCGRRWQPKADGWGVTRSLRPLYSQSSGLTPHPPLTRSPFSRRRRHRLQIHPCKLRKLPLSLLCVKGGGIFAKKWRRDCQKRFFISRNLSKNRIGGFFFYFDENCCILSWQYDVYDCLHIC